MGPFGAPSRCFWQATCGADKQLENANHGRKFVGLPFDRTVPFRSRSPRALLKRKKSHTQDEHSLVEFPLFFAFQTPIVERRHRRSIELLRAPEMNAHDLHRGRAQSRVQMPLGQREPPANPHPLHRGPDAPHRAVISGSLQGLDRRSRSRAGCESPRS